MKTIRMSVEAFRETVEARVRAELQRRNENVQGLIDRKATEIATQQRLEDAVGVLEPWNWRWGRQRGKKVVWFMTNIFGQPQYAYPTRKEARFACEQFGGGGVIGPFVLEVAR